MERRHSCLRPKPRQRLTNLTKYIASKPLARLDTEAGMPRSIRPVRHETDRFHQISKDKFPDATKIQYFCSIKTTYTTQP